LDNWPDEYKKLDAAERVKGARYYSGSVYAKRLAIIVDRRNKIVHEGDLQPMVPRTPWLIDRGDVSQVTTLINDVVGAIDSIV
jgi:hypothetical protein